MQLPRLDRDEGLCSSCTHKKPLLIFIHKLSFVLFKRGSQTVSFLFGSEEMLYFFHTFSLDLTEAHCCSLILKNLTLLFVRLCVITVSFACSQTFLPPTLSVLF